VSWDDHRVAHGDIPSVDQAADGGDLGDALADFYRWQAATWPRLSRSLDGLADVRTRTLTLGDRDVTLQWNPGRETSTTAKIDRVSLAARPCFLCPDNLPPEEKGVPFGDDLVVLVNPAPITPFHLVVSHREHRPQELDGVLADAIGFAIATSGRLTVSYNGPFCGASAPDHLHLQAVEAGSTCDERIVARRCTSGGREAPGRVICQGAGLSAWCDTGSERTLLVFHGSAGPVERGVRTVMAAMADLMGATGEPPVNLLLTADGEQVTALVYPRGAHRPDCYSAEGDAQCLISPGALDMAGLVITVRRMDFERVDEDWMRQIYRETSLDPALSDLLVAEAQRRLARG